jgi:hypothetical protein
MYGSDLHELQKKSGSGEFHEYISAHCLLVQIDSLIAFF